MALSIKHPEAHRLARAVAAATGETLTAAVVQSLRERLARVQRPREPTLSSELLAIAQRCSRLPIVDTRSPAELVGYDERGVPR
jgi:antitoxin VapB